MKKLPAPEACTLAKMIPPPRGVFAPPTLQTFAATCTHVASTLNSVETFSINAPDWASREDWLPVGATQDVVDDLAAGASVVANGHWMSNMDAPFSSPTPVQIFRDAKQP
jgi:hypothetical protein